MCLEWKPLQIGERTDARQFDMMYKREINEVPNLA